MSLPGPMVFPIFQIPIHAPLTESLSTLSRDKLQKLIQYAINEGPAGSLRIIFRRFGMYSKTCLQRPRKNWFSRLIMAKCRSKVLQNALLEHSAILLTCIKLQFVILIQYAINEGPAGSLRIIFRRFGFYGKTCFQRLLKKRPKIGFHDLIMAKCRSKLLQNEHSAIILTCIKLPIVIKIFVFSIFEWPLKTGFTVCLFTQA